MFIWLDVQDNRLHIVTSAFFKSPENVEYKSYRALNCNLTSDLQRAVMWQIFLLSAAFNEKYSERLTKLQTLPKSEQEENCWINNPDVKGYV